MRRRPTVLGPRWRSRSVASMDTTSNHIEADVRTQIAGDPRVPYPAEIAVEVVDRIATLYGVTGVTNEIRVDESRRSPSGPGRSPARSRLLAAASPRAMPEAR